MLNRNILESRVLDKFRLLTLHAVVNESFINGLVFAKEDLTPEYKRGLSKYSLTVLESMGGFDLVTESMKSNIRPENKKFLNALFDICNTSALEATDRVVKETDFKKDSLDEVVDKAAFTKDEYVEFTKKVDSIDNEKIAEIIKDKTITAIKDEKEAYERDEEIQAELEDALKKSEDFKEESLESYMDIFLDKKDIRSHISLFSKLQDVSMDIISHTKESYTEIPFKCLTEITLENTLDIFNVKREPMKALESLSLASESEINVVNKEEITKTATICGIIIYTLLETLKTMNLYSPGKDVVKSFIDTPTSYKNIINGNVKCVKENAEACLNKVAHKCANSTDSKYLSDMLVYTEKYKDIVNNINCSDNLNDTKSAILNKLESIKTMIESRLSGLYEERTTEVKIPHYIKREREEDVAQMNRINTLFSKNPNIKEIRLLVNPKDNDPKWIDIECINSSGTRVDSGFIPINYHPVFGGYMDYVKETFTESKLSSSAKTISIYCTDGSGQRIVLK